MRNLLIIATAALFLGACDTLINVMDTVKTETPHKASDLLNAHCTAFGTDVTRRKNFTDQVNAVSPKAHLMPFDCDGDWKPDYEIFIPPTPAPELKPAPVIK